MTKDRGVWADGSPVTPEDLESALATFEGPIDLKRARIHRLGRPPKAVTLAQMVRIRMTQAQLARLDWVAERQHSSRSAIIRLAVDQYLDAHAA
ncbi:MAG: ribbon-helix-helix domain-containing protein [Bifidobacteriaceae bacterium]|jgi:hypothetical protein|nr:ribbon-helix-helix domain-containing protein [Bifidobacteriaceae bacterium]